MVLKPDLVHRHLLHLGNDEVPHGNFVLTKVEERGVEFG